MPPRRPLRDRKPDRQPDSNEIPSQNHSQTRYTTRHSRFFNKLLEAHANLQIIHAIPAETQPSIQLDLEGQLWHEERSRAREWIDDLQKRAGSNAPVTIAVGSIKERLLEAAAESEADVLVMGKGRRPGIQGRLRDLTYGMVRDSPFPVLIV